MIRNTAKNTALIGVQSSYKLHAMGIYYVKNVVLSSYKQQIFSNPAHKWGLPRQTVGLFLFLNVPTYTLWRFSIWNFCLQLLLLCYDHITIQSVLYWYIKTWFLTWLSDLDNRNFLIWVKFNTGYVRFWFQLHFSFSKRIFY